VSLDRARRWMDMGAEVTNLFVSAHHEGSRVAVPAGLRTIAANAALRSARWMLPGALARGLPEALKADVVVAGREIASGLLIGALLARLARRPLAVTIHSNVEAALKHHGTPRHRCNVLACLRSARLLVPVAQGLVRGLVDLGIRKDRIEVVENGFEPALIRAGAAREPGLALPPGPFLFALGRLSEQKGFDTLIAAHALALRQGAPPHRLLIAGEGPDLEPLKALAAERGVTGSVTFAGFLHDPHAVLARADLFVLPSRWEGFGLALGEAILLGVPSIAADCVSGPREILDGGRYGDLVPVDDVAALAQAITMHFKDPSRLRGQAIAGASYLEERYTAEGAARAHLEALMRITTGERLRKASN
jgi:glycosyltransferase involved in cell wall biosynthesis